MPGVVRIVCVWWRDRRRALVVRECRDFGDESLNGAIKEGEVVASDKEKVEEDAKSTMERSTELDDNSLSLDFDEGNAEDPECE